MVSRTVLHYQNNISKYIFGCNFFKSFASTSSDKSTEQEGTCSGTSKFNDRLLSVLVCPLNKKKLRYDEKRQMLFNDELLIGYKVINGIPNMIPTEAVKLDK